jgi:hypothetical protein
MTLPTYLVLKYPKITEYKEFASGLRQIAQRGEIYVHTPQRGRVTRTLRLAVSHLVRLGVEPHLGT